MNSLIRNHKFIEKISNEKLAFYAVYHGEGNRLINEEERDTDYRTDFQHDRDRIIHSRAFRRLKHKTQVFYSLEKDHYRTRLTHTLEVSQLAMTLARALGLNEDLCQAIALGHDLGHTPFGHTGEHLLNLIMSGHDNLDDLIPNEVQMNLGGFKHNYQSLKVVDLLEKKYEFEGLNLTDWVRQGILCHTSMTKRILYPDLNLQSLNIGETLFLEGQIVAIADEIAQQTHDLEDGIRSKNVDLHDVLGLEILNVFSTRLEDKNFDDLRLNLSRFLINLLMSDVLKETERNLIQFLQDFEITSHEQFFNHRRELPGNLVTFSEKTKPLYDQLKNFVYQSIINSTEINRLEGKAKFIIRKLFKAYLNNPLQLPDYILKRYARLKGEPSLREQPFSEREKNILRYRKRIDFIRLICDYIAGMTDSFALDDYKKLYLPVFLN